MSLYINVLERKMQIMDKTSFLPLFLKDNSNLKDGYAPNGPHLPFFKKFKAVIDGY